MINVGLITIGQSPRVDILTDWKFDLNEIQNYRPMDVLVPPKDSPIPDNIRLYHIGALDFIPPERLHEIEPDRGEPIAVSRLRDGSWQKISSEKLKPYMQECVDKLVKVGCRAILILCSGSFSYLNYEGLLIQTGSICRGIINSSLRKGAVLGLFSPMEQPGAKKQIKPRKFPRYGDYKVFRVVSNPYELPEENIIPAAEKMREHEVDLAYMGCFGYSSKHRKLVAEILGKPVILPRSVAARTLAELYEGL